MEIPWFENLPAGSGVIPQLSTLNSQPAPSASSSNTRPPSRRRTAETLRAVTRRISSANTSALARCVRRSIRSRHALEQGEGTGRARRSRCRRRIAANPGRTRIAGRPRFSADVPWQREFEGAFIFEETPDQLRAIGETKSDMERPSRWTV